MKNINFLWRLTFSWVVIVVRVIKSSDSESVPLPIVAHSNPGRSLRVESHKANLWEMPRGNSSVSPRSS